MRKALFIALLLLALPAAADLPKGEWSVARPLALPQLTAPGLVYLPLDEEALTAQDTSEYRIVRGGRVEVPYRSIKEDGETQVDDVGNKTVDWSERSDHAGKLSATITLDLGASAPPVNVLRFDLGGEGFRAKVTVEEAATASGAGRIVTTDKVYRRGAGFVKDSVTFSPTKQRYLRLTIQREEGKLPSVDTISAWRELEIPLTLVPVSAKLTRKEDYKHRLTILDLDPEKLTRDLFEAVFEVEEPRFSRGVMIEIVPTIPLPGEKPVYSETSWERLSREKPGAPVKLLISSDSARYLRIKIENGDDRPLSISSVNLFRMRRGLVFEADPAQKYELWYGRKGAPAPVYDLAKLPLVVRPTDLPIASLGAPTRLPTAPPPPPPWSKAHPAVFWGVLIGVVLLLVLIIVSALKRTKPPVESV